MAAHLALPRLNCRHHCYGVFAAGQPEGPGDSDAHSTDHLLLSLYLLLCALRKEDTQEVLPVHTLLIIYALYRLIHSLLSDFAYVII